jgi:hypothetical protein
MLQFNILQIYLFSFLFYLHHLFSASVNIFATFKLIKMHAKLFYLTPVLFYLLSK